MKELLLVLSLFMIVYVVSSDENRPIVSVKQGKVQGVSVQNSNGLKFFAYRGIPYAKPATGNLRFRLPEAPEPWSGVRDASKEGNPCWNFNEFNGDIIGDDDCLIVNVYTKEVKRAEEGGKAVMVWIHGGGFSFGSSTEKLYGQGLLVEKDVVAVSINYRLNVFGFLSTGDKEAPGNYGMWDQVAALQWVQDNIREFGGDPGRVTIFGESAGGGSVGLLVASPAAKGLFHGAVAQSGSSACNWSTRKDIPTLSKKFAAGVKCPTDDSKKMMKCLKNKESRELIEGYINNFVKANPGEMLVFSPVVDTTAKPSFMPDVPINLLRKGEFNKVPVIAGMTSNEGGLFHAFMKKVGVKFDEHMFGDGFNDWAEQSFFLERGDGEQVKKEYLTGVDVTKEDVRGRIAEEMFGDGLFGWCQQLFIKTISQHGVPAYLYLLSYPSSEINFARFLGSASEKVPKGPVHLDDVLYLLDNEFPLTYGEEEQTVRQRMVTLWTNFAKTRIPTPETTELLPIKWNPMKADSQQLTCLNIDKDLSIVDGFRKDKSNFWSRIIDKKAQKKSTKDEL